ncbi:hypothetical protein ACFPOE_21855 [Caenimonas terrae]|uniref:Uncharacterized protein n=1 Tax=Caenimonas terrae TaxID=696074 RepID=A0ABW0NKS9_9BURK
MSDPILPIPASHPAQPAGAGGSGEGAQTALAAMIRKRKMGENHVDDDPLDSAPKPLPAA